MSFFTVTKEELEAAKNGGREKVQVKEDVEYTFLIEEVKEKENDKGKYLIIAMRFVGGEFDGKEYPMFVSEHPVAKQKLLKLMSALFSQEDLLSGKINSPAPLIGKSFKTKFKINGEFANNLYYEEANGVPSVGVGSLAVDAADIPF